MGIAKSTLNYDFCSVVRMQLLQRDVDFHDPVVWKTVFTTEMSDEDILMYLNWNSVRLMRRNRPNNLATLIYRCMQQLIAFLDKATLPGATVVHRPNPQSHAQQQQQQTSAASPASSSPSASSPSSSTVSSASPSGASPSSVDTPPLQEVTAEGFVDACAAQNALRILVQILPVVFEPSIVVEQTMRPAYTGAEDEDDAGSASAAQLKPTDELVGKLLQQPQSPFAESFVECFFEQNLRCDARTPGTAFPPLFAENAARAHKGGWDKNRAADGAAMLPVALGEELVVVLTRLCFVPGFSVEYGAIDAAALRYLRGISDENAQCGRLIVRELLLKSGGGLFWEEHDGKAKKAPVVADGGEAAAAAAATEQEMTDEDTSIASPAPAPAAAAAATATTTTGKPASSSAFLFNTVFSFDVLQNRLQLLRCLIVALSRGAMVGRPILAGGDMLRECFVDIARNPLALTLVVSCLEYVCSYESRGAVPYSSHYFAAVPEMVLSKCMEFLCVALAFPPDCCAVNTIDPTSSPLLASESSSSASASAAAAAAAFSSGTTTTTHGRFLPHFVAAASRSRHSLWLALAKLLADEPRAAPALVSGLCTVLNNPVYAASTTLRGSQREIETAHEAACLLWMLSFSPGTQHVVLPVLAAACADSVRHPALFGGAYVVMGLLRIVLRGLEERRHVGNCQTALWTLFLLSSNEESFIRGCLAQPLAAGMCPLPSLEQLNKAKAGSVCVGDALVLALCELCCPAAPRWLLPVTELATGILANVVPRIPRALLEITQFELFHLFEWVTGAFLSVHRTSVNQDACLLAVVDMFVGASRARPAECKPLVASLATEVKLSERLRRFCSMQPRPGGADWKPEQPRIDADMAARLAPLYTPSAIVREMLPLEAFVQLERIAVERMNGGGGAGGDHHGDPYAALDAAIPYFPAGDDGASGVPPLRFVEPSMELLRWGVSQSWAMIVQANIYTPLIDVHRALLFRNT